MAYKPAPRALWSCPYCGNIAQTISGAIRQIKRGCRICAHTDINANLHLRRFLVQHGLIVNQKHRFERIPN